MSFCLRLLSLKLGESGVVLNTIAALGKEDAGHPFLSIGINGKKAPRSFGLLGFSNFTGLEGDEIPGNLLGFEDFSRGRGGEWWGEWSALFVKWLIRRC